MDAATSVEKTAPVVYCDVLTLGLWLRLVVRRVLRPGVPSRIWVIGSVHWAAAALSRFSGISVSRLDVTARQLWEGAGASVPQAVSRQADAIVVDVARRLCTGDGFLARTNRRWGSETIRLHVAKAFRPLAVEAVRSVVIAEVLESAGYGSCAELYVRRKPEFEEADIAARTQLPVRFYGFPWRAALRCRLRGVGWWVRCVLREAASTARFRQNREGNGSASTDPEPTLLLLQENDLSMDRSYRGQPHFIFPDVAQPFRTVILQRDDVPVMNVDNSALLAANISVVRDADLPHVWMRGHRFRGRKALLAEFWRATYLSATVASQQDAFAASAIALLFGQAARLGAFCDLAGVRLFMTSENYRRDADSMQLVREVLPVRTYSYQYSTLGQPNVLMTTTADTMGVISHAFDSVWRIDGCGPKECVAVGYPTDAAFALVKGRAAALRSKLQSAGASFVVSFFDENVGDRFGYIDTASYEAELFELLTFVMTHGDVGLIVKVQFQRNGPGRQPRLRDLLIQAKATGRFVELMHGVHRNNVFPAEAALGSDITIGHVIGGTAALEAALTGTRSILLNGCGYQSMHDERYKRCDLMFATMADALQAIVDFRHGAPHRARLGDWGPILGDFDPFRDGKSSDRLSELLVGAMQGGAVSAASSSLGQVQTLDPAVGGHV